MTERRTRDPVHRVSYAFEPDGENLLVDVWLEPGGKLPEHSHPRQIERWRVLEGEVRFGLAGRKRLIDPADGATTVEPGVKHSLESAGDGVAHLRCEVIPARGLQTFLEDSAAAARAGLIMRGGIPRGLSGARWAARFLARHRQDTVMTFPPRPLQAALIALFARGERAGAAPPPS